MHTPNSKARTQKCLGHRLVAQFKVEIHLSDGLDHKYQGVGATENLLKITFWDALKNHYKHELKHK